MGPFDPFQIGEIEAPGNWRRLQAKLGNLLDELDRRIVEREPFS